MRGLLPISFAINMQDAVDQAVNLASAGDVVLLSPACASFDMYDSFEHRGREFKRSIDALNNSESGAL